LGGVISPTPPKEGLLKNENKIINTKNPIHP
jgi:hypothetical protein